jgi:hypothetical protein
LTTEPKRPVSVSLTRQQKEKLARLGGSKWLQAALESAVDPKTIPRESAPKTRRAK